MKRVFFAVLLLLTIGRPVAAELVDRVVAVVNDDVITWSELNQEGAKYFQRVASKVPPARREEAVREARREVLSGLIDKMIAYQKAEEMGITVTAEEIDAAVAGVLARNNRSGEQFQRDLAAMGITEEEYRQSLREQILRNKLISREVGSKVVILDEQVKTYYEEHYTEAFTGDGYYILQLGLSPDEREDRDEVRARAELLRKRAASGENFRELAAAYSDLPSAEDGGDIGVFKKEEMAPYMRAAVVDLEPGEVSELVETDPGFQFFKLLSVRQGEVVTSAPFDKVKDEIRDRLYQEELDRQYRKWLQALRAQAYIRELLEN